jgi:uncharacterized hydantoinase/oxoprolinase family protein
VSELVDSVHSFARGEIVDLFNESAEGIQVIVEKLALLFGAAKFMKWIGRNE